MFSAVLKNRLLTVFAAAALIATGSVPLCQAGGGNEGSGGGDRIRAIFIEKGQEIIGYLGQDPRGRAIVAEYSLSLDTLKDTLDVKRIKVERGPLRDRANSLVDAVLKGKTLYLDQQRWTDQFLESKDVLPELVFHEMLRLSLIYDDENYRISGEILKSGVFVHGKVPDCVSKDVDASQAEPGFRCRTQAGFVLERVSIAGAAVLGWKDPSGTVWSDDLGALFTHDQAMAACQNLGMAVTSGDEESIGDQYGRAEVIPTGKPFWISDVGSFECATAPDSDLPGAGRHCVVPAQPYSGFISHAPSDDYAHWAFGSYIAMWTPIRAICVKK